MFVWIQRSGIKRVCRCLISFRLLACKCEMSLNGERTKCA